MKPSPGYAFARNSAANISRTARNDVTAPLAADLPGTIYTMQDGEMQLTEDRLN